jgi:hypothetical protein
MFKLLFGCIALLLLSCSKAISWEGNYFCEAELGSTAGGSAVIVEYDLKIAGDGCLLTINGFQVSESIVCKVQTNEDEIIINFSSYENGSTKNIHNIEVYKVGSTLFSLKKHTEKITTQWVEAWPGEPLKKNNQCFNKI